MISFVCVTLSEFTLSEYSSLRSWHAYMCISNRHTSSITRKTKPLILQTARHAAPS